MPPRSRAGRRPPRAGRCRAPRRRSDPVAVETPPLDRGRPRSSEIPTSHGAAAPTGRLLDRTSSRTGIRISAPGPTSTRGARHDPRAAALLAPCPRGRDRGPSRAPRPDALSRPGPRGSLDLRHRPSLHAAGRRALAPPLRLARRRGPAQRLRPVRGRHRRDRPALRARARQRPGARAAPACRMAGPARSSSSSTSSPA